MTARDRGKLPAIALAVALSLTLVGSAFADHSTDSEIITTGHTTYLEASTTANECFAGITGMLSQTVTWFNGQNLFSRPVDGDGDTYMYVMEHFNSAGYDFTGDGTPDREGVDSETGIEPFDPSEETLHKTGNEWHLEDPNNDHYSEDKTWVVEEYYALKIVEPYADSEGGNDLGDQEKVYIYTVAVGSPREDQTINREYNFITTVDTCKFLHDGNTTTHDNQNDDNPRDPAGQHDEGADPGEHPHGTFHVDLFVGDEPSSIPAPEGALGGSDGGDGGEGS